MDLYRLEWMKIRLSAYLQAILGIFVSLLALGILFLFIFQMEAGEPGASEEAALFASWNGLLALTTALSFACFSIFSAVIASKVIVSEYCGKNAVVLLSYPVDRRKMLDVKCRVVSSMTVVFAWISQTVTMGIVYLSAHIFGIMPQGGTGYFVFVVMISGFLMGILSSEVGMISAAFGWKKGSVSAAILCSLVIVCALTNSIAVFPDSILWVMLTMSAGLLVAVGFVYQILAGGIEKMEV